jgi:putative spermidine/putrescine transport system permease protein
MVESRLTRALVRLGAGFTLFFIYFPLIVIALYAFNENVTQEWPISDWGTKWFSVAYNNESVREALKNSVVAALAATAVALVLGTLASMAIARYRFFGREAVTFAVILPIALPGIITGLALLARLRRTAGSLDEASADLGADSWQTFRYVMFPQMRTALLAGGLLAFGLSFDEIIVTIFTSGAIQTLPIWMYATLFRPTELPIVNVVALFVILISVIPIYFAQRLAGDTGVPGRQAEREARRAAR